MFSQNLVKAGFRASPKINESRSCVVSYKKLNELLESITSLFIKKKKNNLPFPLTMRQVEVSVKVTSMVRYNVTCLLSWSISGCKLHNKCWQSSIIKMTFDSYCKNIKSSGTDRWYNVYNFQTFYKRYFMQINIMLADYRFVCHPYIQAYISE